MGRQWRKIFYGPFVMAEQDLEYFNLGHCCLAEKRNRTHKN